MDDLLNSPMLDGALQSIAEAGAARARASAPRVSGDYAASIRVWQDETDRRVWRYGSDVDYAMAVEANTGNLGRSLS